MCCVRIIGRNNITYRKVGDYCISEGTNECCILCSYCQCSYETENLFWLHIRDEHNFVLPPTPPCEAKITNLTCGDNNSAATEIKVTKFINELEDMLDQQPQMSYALTSLECNASCSGVQEENETCHVPVICESEKENKACETKIINRPQNLNQNSELLTCISNLETEIYKDDVSEANLAPFIRDIEEQVVRTTFSFSSDTLMCSAGMRCDSFHLPKQAENETTTNALKKDIDRQNHEPPKIFEEYKALIKQMEIETFTARPKAFERIGVGPTQATLKDPKGLNEDAEYDLMNFKTESKIYVSLNFDPDKRSNEIEGAKAFNDESKSLNQTEVLKTKDTGITIIEIEDCEILNDETLIAKPFKTGISVIEIKDNENIVQHSKDDDYHGSTKIQNVGTICELEATTDRNDLKREDMFEADTNVQRDSATDSTASENLCKQKIFDNLLEHIENSNQNQTMHLAHAIKQIHEKYTNLQNILNTNPIQSISQALSVIPIVPLETTFEILALDNNIRRIKSLRNAFYNESLILVAAEPDLFTKIIWKLIMTDKVASAFSWDGERDQYSSKYPIKDMAIFDTLQDVFRQKFPSESGDYFKDHTISYFNRAQVRMKRDLTETLLLRKIKSCRANRVAMIAERQSGS